MIDNSARSERVFFSDGGKIGNSANVRVILINFNSRPVEGVAVSELEIKDVGS